MALALLASSRMVEVAVEYYDLPTMDRYRSGETPRWEPTYRTSFSRGAEQPRREREHRLRNVSTHREVFSQPGDRPPARRAAGHHLADACVTGEAVGRKAASQRRSVGPPGR